jgi:hypothetical protein
VGGGDPEDIKDESPGDVQEDNLTHRVPIKAERIRFRMVFHNLDKAIKAQEGI